MKKIFMFLTCIVLVSSQLQAQDSNKRFLIRNSVNIFWNTGWGYRFFFGPPFDSLHSAADYERTLRHTTLGNPQLWWRAASSPKVAIYLTLSYQYLSMSLRDSLFYPQERYQKALEARLDFFSVGCRVQLKFLPFEPYFGQNIGYCYGKLSTLNLREDLEKNQLDYYVLVDGSGGGFFFDLLVGAQHQVRRDFGVFIESGFRFTPVWRAIEAESIYSTRDPSRIGHWAWEDRYLKFQGPYVALGLQARL
jgi:hypothetical protein